MRYLFKIVMIFFVLISYQLSAQSQKDTIQYFKKKKPKDIFISPGVSHQNMFLYDINVLVGRIEYGHGGPAVGGYRLGVESNLHNDLIWAPKIGAEISGMIICMRCSVIPYFQNSKVDLRLMPEFGLSWFGTINLTYGYKIKILNDKINNMSNHSIGLSFNLNKELWEDIYF